MNTLQVEDLLRLDCNLASTFEGVFASDRLPKFSDLKSALVLNFDPISKPGSHWVAIYVDNGVGEYFDSYGEPPFIGYFVNFLKQNCRTWTYNKKEMQALDSDVCGYYCIWFLSERARGKSLLEITSKFSNNHNKNDLIVKKQVETRFGRIKENIINKDSCTVQCCVKRKR
jgi:hypothetical protein